MNMLMLVKLIFCGCQSCVIHLKIMAFFFVVLNVSTFEIITFLATIV
jgi:hypothetical protein